MPPKRKSRANPRPLSEEFTEIEELTEIAPLPNFEPVSCVAGFLHLNWHRDLQKITGTVEAEPQESQHRGTEPQKPNHYHAEAKHLLYRYAIVIQNICVAILGLGAVLIIILVVVNTLWIALTFADRLNMRIGIEKVEYNGPSIFEIPELVAMACVKVFRAAIYGEQG